MASINWGPGGPYISMPTYTPPRGSSSKGYRQGSPSVKAKKPKPLVAIKQTPAPRQTTTSKVSSSKPAPPQRSLRALERDPKYGGTPSKKAPTKSSSTKKSSAPARSGGSVGSVGGGGSGVAVAPPPDPLTVLANQLGGQLSTLFGGLAITQQGLKEDYDKRSLDLLSRIESDYATADAQIKASQQGSQNTIDDLARRVGMTGVTGTVDDAERRLMNERILQLNAGSKAASDANFDMLRTNYGDYLGDKVNQANASGVMAQVQLMDLIQQLRAAQGVGGGGGSGGGGGGGGSRGRGRSSGGRGRSRGGGSSSGATVTEAPSLRTPMPTPPGPISGVKNLEPPANWQGGRVGSPSIAVKRYPGVSNPARTAKKAPVKVIQGYGRRGSPSIAARRSKVK